MSARLVIDASVALKWLLAEPDSILAEPLIHEDLCAPDLMLVECANAAWKEVEREGANPEELKQLFGSSEPSQSNCMRLTRSLIWRWTSR